LGAYLIGSLSFAVIVTKLMGMADPRTYGSKNPGATNVLRSGKKLAAALTLLGDGLKGWVAVLLVQQFGPAYGLGEQAVAMAGLAVLAGHMWPVFFGFKGGKGVATAVGVLAAFNGWLALAALATWLFMAFVVKISSLSAICLPSWPVCWCRFMRSLLSDRKVCTGAPALSLRFWWYTATNRT